MFRLCRESLLWSPVQLLMLVAVTETSAGSADNC